jgi:purine catabolism regulator
MPVTVASLLAYSPLSLRLVSGEEDALTHIITWAHSSDLEDPTPFLSENNLLLTNGKQFDAGHGFTFDSYVARLAERGISAVGFGLEVVRDGVPTGLVEACAAHGVPLLEVPYDVPFIAISQRIAAVHAVDERERDSWALKASRAIASAALRPDGLAATLRELGAQLDCWVMLYDSTGALSRSFPERTELQVDQNAIAIEVAALLSQRVRGGRSFSLDSEPITAQTLGAPDSLRGVLVIGGVPALDQAGRLVVANVIALASLALESNQDLHQARDRLRVGLYHLLLSGSLDVVARVADEMVAPLPAEPFAVVRCSASATHLDRMQERLEVDLDAGRTRLFFAATGDRVTILTSDKGLASLGPVFELFDVTAGVSDPTTYADLTVAVDQADHALDVALNDGLRLADHQTVVSNGVQGLIRGANPGPLAASLIAEGHHYDEAHGTELIPSTMTWIEANGQWDVTARSLGIHRHTLRQRVERVEALLNTDFSVFQNRIDFWVAVMYSGLYSPARASDNASPFAVISKQIGTDSTIAVSLA